MADSERKLCLNPSFSIARPCICARIRRGSWCAPSDRQLNRGTSTRSTDRRQTIVDRLFGRSEPRNPAAWKGSRTPAALRCAAERGSRRTGARAGGPMVRRDLSTPQERFPLKTGKCVPLSDVVVILSRLGRARKTIGDGKTTTAKLVAADLTMAVVRRGRRDLRNAVGRVSPSSGAKELPSDVGSRTPIASFGSNTLGSSRSRRTRG